MPRECGDPVTAGACLPPKRRWLPGRPPSRTVTPESHHTLILRRHPRDEARAALEGDVVPQPDERHHEAVPDLDQEEDVDDAPEQPAEESAQLQRPELHDRGAPPDGGEIALVTIAERRGRGRAGDPRRDQPASI